MQTDLGFDLIDKIQAFEIIKSYENKCIYIKSTVNFIENNELRDTSVIYSKINVDSIVDYDDIIILYSNDDSDRVLINKNDVIQSEIQDTENGKNFKFILSNNNTQIWLYLSEDFISNTIRERTSKVQEQIKDSKTNLVITEGKTDWKHLKRALKKYQENDGLFLDNNFKFLDDEQIKMGNGDLLSLCEQISKIQNDYKIICIFDADVDNISKKVSPTDGGNFKYWGNNVYSFITPIPKHRESTPNISIEHYYTDEELKTEDSNGRRLYIGNEFSNKSGLNLEKTKFCVNKNKCGNKSIAIIDSDIYYIEDETKNIALSKNTFSDYVLKETEPFNNIGYNNFKPLFEIIQGISSQEKGMSTILNHPYIQMAKELKIQEYRVLFQENNIITAIIRESNEKVLNFKNSNLLQVWSQYMPEHNAIVIFISLSTTTINEDSTIAFAVNLNNELRKDALIKLSNGVGQLEVLCTSDDLKTQSMKSILNSETSRFLLKRELDKAGLID